MGAAIFSVVLAIIGLTYTESVQKWAGSIRSKAEKLSQEIYTKLMANNQTKEKLMDAFQRKDTSLLTQLINQAGFSNQKVALTKAVTSARQEYLAKKKLLDKEGTELTNQYNKVNNAANYSGSTISGNVHAENTINEVENLVNGGYHEENQQQTQS
jgi:uncharacterized membrane protein YhiD involved in acid resistance